MQVIAILIFVNRVFDNYPLVCYYDNCFFRLLKVIKEDFNDE